MRCSLFVLSVLQELVARACLPGTAGLQLYTAPPKAVLQQPQVLVLGWVVTEPVSLRRCFLACSLTDDHLAL